MGPRTWILVGQLWLDAPAQMDPLPLLSGMAGWGDVRAHGPEN